MDPALGVPEHAATHALGVPEHAPVATLGLPYDAAVRVAERLAHGPAQRLAAAALTALPCREWLWR